MSALAQTISAVVILATLAVFLFRIRSRVSRCNTRPLSGAERVLRWHDKVDERIGIESEEFLSMKAAGSETKRRMLMEFRNRARGSWLTATPKPPLIEVMERRGIEQQQRNVKPLAQLKTFTPAKPIELDIPVTTVRKKLRLATNR